MLVKQKRLTKQKDFEKVFKQGRPYYSKLLGIKAGANQLTNNRYGVIISSKISKKSVDRNKLKRQINSAIRQLDNGLKPGYDLAVIALPAMVGENYQAIASELERALLKLKLFKHNA